MSSGALFLVCWVNACYGVHSLVLPTARIDDVSYGSQNGIPQKEAALANLFLSMHVVPLDRVFHQESRLNLRSDAQTSAMSEGLSFEDLNKLEKRMNEVRSYWSEPEAVRVFDFDAMVPGQRLSFEVPQSFIDALDQLEADERECAIVMVGRAGLQLYRNGVECILESVQKTNGAFQVTLKATRFCELLEVGETEGSRWLGRKGKVRWINLDAMNADETNKSTIVDSARYIEKLSDKWIELVQSTGRERFAGQVKQVLSDLGPMPSADEPNARALWLAGLINPLPALGVALEIRPQILMAESTSERLNIAVMGVIDSITRLKQSGPPF